MTPLKSVRLAVVGIASALFAVLLAWGYFYAATAQAQQAPADKITFPNGTATASADCGACHQAIYREFAEGFGGDMHWAAMKPYPNSTATVALPAGVPPGITAHALAGIDPWPLEALQVEKNGARCIVCHFPLPLTFPDMAAAQIERPHPRPANQEGGLTCASCHLTADGRIRGPYAVNAPHETVMDPLIQTSVACAFCHADGPRVVGKQTQTFLEWREDFHNKGLGPQQCQDCHMPKTTRKLAEDFDVPERVSARHLWTGGHSVQRLSGALNLRLEQTGGGAQFALHVINVGAGHSVPTGSNRRGMTVTAEALGADGKVLASQEWFFAPYYGNRPDDRAFLDQDRAGPDPVATAQADAQGPHETIIRAGEDRILNWKPSLPPGSYRLRARAVYDLNRYNDRAFGDDQTEIAQASLAATVTAPR